MGEATNPTHPGMYQFFWMIMIIRMIHSFILFGEDSFQFPRGGTIKWWSVVYYILVHMMCLRDGANYLRGELSHVRWIERSERELNHKTFSSERELIEHYYKTLR